MEKGPKIGLKIDAQTFDWGLERLEEVIGHSRTGPTHNTVWPGWSRRAEDNRNDTSENTVFSFLKSK